MRQGHRRIHHGVVVRGRADPHRLRRVPVVRGKGQGILVVCEIRVGVHGHLGVRRHVHRHGHVRGRLRGQNHRVGSVVPFLHRQGGRTDAHSALVVVRQRQGRRTAGLQRHPSGQRLNLKAQHYGLVVLDQGVVRCRHRELHCRLAAGERHLRRHARVVPRRLVGARRMAYGNHHRPLRIVAHQHPHGCRGAALGRRIARRLERHRHRRVVVVDDRSRRRKRRPAAEQIRMLSIAQGHPEGLFLCFVNLIIDDRHANLLRRVGPGREGQGPVPRHVVRTHLRRVVGGRPVHGDVAPADVVQADAENQLAGVFRGPSGGDGKGRTRLVVVPDVQRPRTRRHVQRLAQGQVDVLDVLVQVVVDQRNRDLPGPVAGRKGQRPLHRLVVDALLGSRIDTVGNDCAGRIAYRDLAGARRIQPEREGRGAG